MSSRVDVPLHRLVHARSGDKGNRLNIAVVCRNPTFYPVLVKELTAERVAEVFACASALCCQTV